MDTLDRIPLQQHRLTTQFSSVHTWYLYKKKYALGKAQIALRLVFQWFLPVLIAFENFPNVGLIDDGLFSSSQGCR